MYPGEVRACQRLARCVAVLDLRRWVWCGVVGSALGTGVVPVPAYPNMDPVDSATAAVSPKRAD